MEKILVKVGQFLSVRIYRVLFLSQFFPVFTQLFTEGLVVYQRRYTVCKALRGWFTETGYRIVEHLCVSGKPGRQDRLAGTEV